MPTQLKNDSLNAIMAGINYADFESKDVRDATIALIKSMDSGLESSGYSPMQDEVELAAEVHVAIGEVAEELEQIEKKVEEEDEGELDDDDLEGDD